MRSSLLLLTVLAACSASSEPLDGLADRLTQAYCELQVRCCEQGELVLQYDDVDSCVYRTEPFIEKQVAEWQEEARDEGLAYSSEKGDACIARLRAGCGIKQPELGARLISELCGPLFLGVGQPGEACSSDWNCADGLVCADERCQVSPGDGTCASSAWCAAEEYCQDGGMCWPLVADGKSCSEDRDCASGGCVGATCEAPICDGR